MQSLFAFEQCKEANGELALDLIEQRFAPDLNSMEFQDKPLLTKKKKEAKSLYTKALESGTVKSEDDQVKSVVDEAIAFFHQQTKKDFTLFKKNLVAEVEKINYWYLNVLGLLLAFADASKADKKTDYSSFRDNRVIRALKKDISLAGLLAKNNAAWENDRALIQSWFKDVVKTDTVFSEYSGQTNTAIEEDKSLIKHLVRKIILGPTVINDYFQEKNIHWTEDHDIVKSLVEKTIKSIEADSLTIQLQKLSMDWEDDLVFMNTLFQKTTELDKSKRELIAQNTKNWEVDRLPLTDRVTLEMAIAELINFPAIPVKVTINEYIELTKHYSTPKSAKFINGILDVIAKELVAEGQVKKSGRGLIDNK